MPFPDDLETAYSDTFVALIKSVNISYELELRKVLKTIGVEKAAVRNALHVEDMAVRSALELNDTAIRNAFKVEDEVTRNALVSRINAATLNALVSRLNANLYQDTLKKVREIRAGLFNKNLFKKTLASMDNIMKRLAGGVRKDIIDQLNEEKTPIPELPLLADSDALDQAIELNVSLISDITETQAIELEDKVLQSVMGGLGPEAIIEEVKNISGNGEAYAEFVGRDQLAKTYASINQEQQQSVGFPGYIWIATGGENGDGRNREDHLILHGTYHLWSEPPLVKAGNRHPGEDYQCRCLARGSFGPE